MRFAVVSALLAGLLAAPAFAALPAPSPEAKAKAAEAAAKSAWADKVGAYQLCAVEDRIADTYRKNAIAAGKDVPPEAQMAACANPGPYAAAAASPAAKPLEASGAHSPAATAVSPPGSNATAAEISGGVKK